MAEPNRRWTDPVGSQALIRRIVVEERHNGYGTEFAVYFEGADGRRQLATELTLDEAMCSAMLALANGRGAPFLRSPEAHASYQRWVRGLNRKRVIEPWERFLPEHATQPGEMSF